MPPELPTDTPVAPNTPHPSEDDGIYLAGVVRKQCQLSDPAAIAAKVATLAPDVQGKIVASGRLGDLASCRALLGLS